MFHKSRLFFWTVEILLVSLVIFLWGKMGSLFSPFVSVAQTFFIPFLLGGFLYYITNPLVDWMEKKLKMKRLLAIFIVFIILILFLVISITNLIPSLISQLTGLISASQGIYKQVQSLLSQLQNNAAFKNIDFESLLKEMNLSYVDILKNVLNSITVSLSSVVSVVTSVVMVLVMAPIILFYLLKDGKNLLPMLKGSVLKHDRLNIVDLLHKMNETISRYISGVAMDALFIFIFAFIGYTVMGMSYAFLFAFIAAIMNIIPYLGPYLGLAPVVIAYIATDPKKMIIAVIYIMILQQIDGNIVYPRIVGSAMKVHPLTIMVLLVLGGNIAGLVGMLIAVPVYAIVKELVKFLYGIYEHHRNHKSML